MRSPDDNPSETAGTRFQRREIANAAFIFATAIVDHEHIARAGWFHRFEKNIHTAKMFGRQGAPGQTLPWNDLLDSRRRDQDRQLQTQRRIGDQRCG